MKIAIVLNGNARSVTTRVINKVHQSLKGEDLFVSSSLKEALDIAKNIVDNKYDVVMCGGGDGTFSKCVSNILALHPKKEPSFGIIRFGTGNALADVLGVGPSTSQGIERELQAAKYDQARTTISLVRVGNMIAPFAGMGMDAMILEDYDQVKKDLDNIPFVDWFKAKRGVIDYATAISTLSFWKALFNNSNAKVSILNKGNISTQIDRHGYSIGGDKGAGEIIYEGTSSMVAVSTIPLYGMGFKLFPQVNPSVKGFQLRVINLKLYEILMNFPGFIFNDVFHKHISDFSCDSIKIKSNRALPAQVGGDIIGKVDSMEIETVTITAVLGSIKSKDLLDNKRNHRL